MDIFGNERQQRCAKQVLNVTQRVVFLGMQALGLVNRNLLVSVVVPSSCTIINPEHSASINLTMPRISTNTPKAVSILSAQSRICLVDARDNDD